MYVIDEATYLQHHGIKGMRWGVRKDDAASPKVSFRERRAQKYEKKASKIQDTINSEQTKMDTSPNFVVRRLAESKIYGLEETKNQVLNDAALIRDGKLTTKDKQLIAGATFVAAMATYKLADAGDIHRTVEIGKNFVNNQQAGDQWKKNDVLSATDLSPEELLSTVVQGVNPDYGGLGTLNNCRRATFAYELRRRGNDVQATKTMDGTGQTTIGLHNAISPNKAIYNGPGAFAIENTVHPNGDVLGHGFSKVNLTPYKTESVPEAIFNSLKLQPNGARGEVGVLWQMGGAHSVAWEVVNNEPVIFDTQSGKMYSTPESLLDLPAIKKAGYTRLDNVELNNDFLQKWVKNAKH